MLSLSSILYIYTYNSHFSHLKLISLITCILFERNKTCALFSSSNPLVFFPFQRFFLAQYTLFEQIFLHSTLQIGRCRVDVYVWMKVAPFIFNHSYLIYKMWELRWCFCTLLYAILSRVFEREKKKKRKKEPSE